MSHRDRLRWAAVALACALAFVLTALVGIRTGVGVRLDRAIGDTVHNGLPEVLRRALDSFARPLAIVALAPACLVLALLACVRRSWHRAAAGVVIAVASAVLALELRIEDTLGLPGGAFPSDHAAVAFGLLVAAVVLWPTPLTDKGLWVPASAAIAIGVGNVSWYAHQPRDVVGSALLVAAISATTFALVGGDSPNVRARTPAERQPAPPP